MENKEIQPWWFVVEPYEGESISHFLGRFRRGPMKLYKIGQPWQNEHFYCQ
jgi:hypothetical protein